ncbi:PfkB family carbohydrate kinase [Opitutus sp. ER46]|uniref:PfkB family carbohydrate kinase n=1 Tax=Opitutus sp. ER46 TaxID=2161864 RepID=UPI000D302737|nr:PfkB family carbohydrate kinase [Opitutus sp. ER46]PTX94192.1 sugar kinase [Opitutus sp. ER46]
MFRQTTLQQLAARREHIGARSALLGFDGFVDTIVTPVRLRNGQGENFEPIATITEFGQRILGAAGKSTNLELFPRIEKLGGNGPIMANSLLASGARVTYVGALGRDQVHPVFGPMAARARAFTLCAPAHTTAVEFGDGKLMLGMMRSFDEITYDRIVEVMGTAAFEAELAGAHLVGLVNWTMIPNMTAIFTELVDRVLPRLPASPERVFFFDLADPEKRSVADLKQALAVIARFGQFGRVTLGLNLKEAQQVAAAVGCQAPGVDEASLRAACTTLRARLEVATVVIHPRESAACATAEGAWWVPGPYTATPKITTGAGDHFNAGFSTGQLLGLSPEACLGVGVCTSGHYVRTGESPSLAAVETFLANWR